MDDRKKVIRNLKELLALSRYNDGVGWNPDNDTETLEAALALLEAQEPHVVTIADYKSNPNVDKDGNLAVWRESRRFNGIAHHEDGWTILNRDRVEGWYNSEVTRFWTSRPTDEQTEATPWK